MIMNVTYDSIKKDVTVSFIVEDLCLIALKPHCDVCVLMPPMVVLHFVFFL